jgi:hypothetical protein
VIVDSKGGSYQRLSSGQSACSSGYGAMARTFNNTLFL